MGEQQARSADDLEIRPVTEDEFPNWVRAIVRGFGDEISEERIASWRPVWGDLSRTIAAFQGDRIVGTNGEWEFTMSVPDGEPVPCAGVTVVTVASDWRRRGVLSAMMRFQLDRIRERGTEPFAALYASESPIYGRFGYGTAAPAVHYKLERSWARMDPPGDGAAVQLVDADEAIASFPAILETARARRGGMMSRAGVEWQRWLGHDFEGDRDGFSPRYHAVIPGRGYAVYRVRPEWSDRGARGRLRVLELVATDPDAEASLWQFVFDVDLMHEIEASLQPPDGALPLRLAYRGRLHEQLTEGLWLRLVDVGRALVSRGYREDGRLVVDVADRFCPWNTGVWTLEVLDGQANCEMVDAPPDLRLDVAALASLTLGGVSPRQLASAGRIDELTPGALARADRMFAVDAAPWNPSEF